MANRLAALERIQAVQAQMVRLTEWKLAAADKACRHLKADQERLRDYVAGENALGVLLAKAALKSMDAVESKLVQAEQVRALETDRLGALKRRENVASSMRATAAVEARRSEEDRDLAQTMEAWLASRGASLR